MDSKAVRAYMNRDWAAVRRLKEQGWYERLDRLGPIEAFRVADDLRAEAALLRGPVPEEERAADLAAHVALASLLRKANAARRR